MARLPRWLLVSLGAVLGLAIVFLAGHAIRPPSPAPHAMSRRALTAGSAAGVVRRASAAVVRVSAWRQTLGQPALRRVVGSGFVAAPGGLVLTNAELVAGAARVDVRCPGVATTLAARVAVLDFGRGAALLQLRRPLCRAPVLRLGPDAGSPAGGFVLSLGGGGTTLGVVSATPRLVGVRDGPVRHLLQTDAPIPAVNLGGPLLDLDGRVIGMAAPPIGGRGIGFAVPARELREVLRLRVGTALRVRSGHWGPRRRARPPEKVLSGLNHLLTRRDILVACVATPAGDSTCLWRDQGC